jgi:AcrR family transcriptional regulator
MPILTNGCILARNTLYRYFASKDLILLDPIFGNRDFSATFSRHAVNLTVEEALAEVILEWARWQDSNAEEILLVRALIDQAPLARAKLWDILYQQERALSARLAEKLHLHEDDLRVVLSARHVLLTIIGTAAEQWRASAGRSSSIAIAKQVMRMFEDHKVLTPGKASRR